MKGALLAWMLGSGWLAIQHGLWGSLPFVVLFGSGYAWLILADAFSATEPGRTPAPDVLEVAVPS